MVSVSVVMGVYNGAATIQHSLDSLLAQTYQDFEIVLVDDGSTDNLDGALAAYSDPRIRLIRHEVNQGLAQALNTGLAHAEGKYIARLDADDTSHPTRFAKQVALLDAQPEVAVVSTQATVIRGSSPPEPAAERPLHHAMICWLLLFWNPLVHTAAMMRREVIEAVGGYDPAFSVTEDINLWMRLAFDHQFANLPEPLVTFDIRAGYVGSDYYQTQVQQMLESRRQFISRLIDDEVTTETVSLLRHSQMKLGKLDRRPLTRDQAETLTHLVRRAYAAMQAKGMIGTDAAVKRDYKARLAQIKRATITPQQWRLRHRIMAPLRAFTSLFRPARQD